MPVTLLLAAVAKMTYMVPESVICQIWRLAENSGDIDVMRVLAGRPGPLPSEVVERLRLRKESELRIEYLSRADLTDAERATLLETEKRSDVFAGLIAAAKDNPALATRLTEQFAVKPTKVLARQMLRDGFGEESLRYACLKVLAGDRRHQDWLWRKLRAIVEENAKDEARTTELVDILPVGLLLFLDMAFLGEYSQLKVVDRLSGYASRDYDPNEWESRRLHNTLCRYLVAASALPGLTDAVVNALDALATAEWIEDGDSIAGALAGRRALMGDSVDKQRLGARTATGAKLESMVKLALVDSSHTLETLVQGLLENPAVWDHTEFQTLVSKAPVVCLVKAMQATRSHDLMSRLWQTQERHIPEACWEHIDNPQKLNERLIVETLNREEQPYRVQSQITTLLERGVSDEAIARLPYSVIAHSSYHRRYNSPILDAAAPQLVRLQVAMLGENSHFWENFNTLAADWSGSLGELLEACTTL